MPSLLQTTAFHTDRDAQGRPLTASEREKLLKPYLPPRPQPKQHPRREPSVTAKQARFVHQPRLRPALRTLLHYALFTLIHAIFSIYIRCRQTYHVIIGRVLAVIYYHHRTPEYIQRDVRQLDKVPGHLSVVLELEGSGGGRNDRLETLVAEACEVAAWSACAGVPMLSIYEKTGKLTISLEICGRTLMYIRRPKVLSSLPPPPHLQGLDLLLRYFIVETHDLPPGATPPFLLASPLTRPAQQLKWLGRQAATSSGHPASVQLRLSPDAR